MIYRKKGILFMHKEMKYSTSLTGASFLFYEIKQIVKLKNKFSQENIKEMVYQKIYFNIKLNQVLTSITAIMRRVDCLTEELQNSFRESIDTAKVINLYAIMKTDRLLFEFMNEVVKERIEYNYGVIEKKDINVFFLAKVEQSETVSKWSDATVSKLKQVIMKILREVGIVEDIKTGKVHKLYISEELKDYLIKLGDKSYVCDG